MAEFIELDRLLSGARAPDTAVAWRDGRIVDFSEFALRVAAWRETFLAVDGVRIALFFEDSAEFAAALFGVWHAGKEAVLAPDVLPETRHALGRFAAACAGDWPGSPGLRRVDCAGLPADLSATWPVLDAQRTALHVFTSGSTGAPTLIAKSLAQLCREIAALDAHFGARIGRGCVHASVTHQHMYGLPFRVLWPLASGRQFAAKRCVFPEDLLRALAQTPGSVLITSPAHLKRLPLHLDWTHARANLTALFSSAGPLPESALPLCDRVFARRPLEIYGSSETGAVAWRERQPGSGAAWQALPGMQWQIVDGQLLLQAPWLGASGWQATADRVAACSDGFELRGRDDQIVKIEEKRVSLQAVEAAVCASGLVAEARALLLPGERARIGVVAVPNAAGWLVHDDAGRRALGERLRAVLAGVVDAVAVPRHWRFRWALPLNSTGKTTIAALLAMFDARRPPARLLEHSANGATLLIDVCAASPFFDGHFSDAPVLPGVAQVDWAMLFARELFELPPHFAGLDHVKFHDWIGADTRIRLELQRAAPASVAFRISSEIGLHASGRIRFRDAA